jgi:hypothetical protein
LLEAGVALECVTPERALGPDIGGSNCPQYAKAFAAADDVRVTLLHTLHSVERRRDTRLIVRLHSDYADRVVERVAAAAAPPGRAARCGRRREVAGDAVSGRNIHAAVYDVFRLYVAL